MNEENLEEFEEMGIPIEDFSAEPSSQPETNNSQDVADGVFDTPSLPELFDEDELAKVGLVAGDGDTFRDEPENHEALSGKASDLSDEDQIPESKNKDSEEDSFGDPMAVYGNDTPTDYLFAGDDANDEGSAEAAEYADQVSHDTGAATEKMAPHEFDEPDLLGRIDQLGFQMASLQREFEGKLKYDAHKDEIIDKLHNELQEYKQDILKKHILSIVMDVVKVADDIRKWLTYFRSLEVSQRDPRKLFRYLEAIPSDLEDIFYWHGVRPFSTAEGIFDPARQRAIKKIPSMDASQDKLIAESLRPGYEWDGKVIRQEMVAVYVYQEEQESSTMGMNNE